jgi:hypothetical protein
MSSTLSGPIVAAANTTAANLATLRQAEKNAETAWKAAQAAVKAAEAAARGDMVDAGAALALGPLTTIERDVAGLVADARPVETAIEKKLSVSAPVAALITGIGVAIAMMVVFYMLGMRL